MTGEHPNPVHRTSRDTTPAQLLVELIAVRVCAEVRLAVLLCQVLSPPQAFAAATTMDDLTPLVVAEALNWTASVDH